jgi:hypothetical protein
MAPFWAHATVAAPSTKDKRTALAVHPEPTGLRIKRDAFKVSSKKSHPYILLNPEAFKKLYGMVQSNAQPPVLAMAAI